MAEDACAAKSRPHERYSAIAIGPGLPGAGGRGLATRARCSPPTCSPAASVHPIVIDKGDGVALQTRAIGIHARTLEVLGMTSLAGRFTERGQVVRQLRFYSRGRCLTSLESGRCGSRFGFLLDFPQTRPNGCCAPGSPNWAARSSRKPSSPA